MFMYKWVTVCMCVCVSGVCVCVLLMRLVWCITPKNEMSVSLMRGQHRIEMGILAFRFSVAHKHTGIHESMYVYMYIHVKRQTMITPSDALIPTHTNTHTHPPFSRYRRRFFFSVSLMRAFLWAFCIIHHRQTCLQSVYEYYMGI